MFLLATVGSDFGTCILVIVQCHVKNCCFGLNVSNVTGDNSHHVIWCYQLDVAVMLVVTMSCHDMFSVRHVHHDSCDSVML